MNAVQQRNLSVRQIAAIVRRLSPEDTNELIDLIWDHLYVVPKHIHEGYVEHLKKEEALGRMIPLEEAKNLRLK